MNEYKRYSEIDPETLAAFIEGKLNAQERARVIEALRDPGLYESLMEASAIHAELNKAEPGPEGDVLSIWERIKKSKRLQVAVPTAAAAVLATILVVSRIIQSGAGPETLALLQNAAWYDNAQKSGAQSVLGANWSTPSWPATRGGKTNQTSRGSEFRGGVLLVTLNVAATTKDDAALAETKLQLKRVLDEVPGGGPVSAELNATSESTRDVLANDMKQLFNDSPWYRLGIWLGQARLNAMTTDLSCFARGEPCTSELTDVRAGLAADPATRTDANSKAVLQDVDTLLEQMNKGEVTNATELSDSLNSILNLAALSQ